MAPGRANLIGEHTDHGQGFVAPFALELGVSIAMRRRCRLLCASGQRDSVSSKWRGTSLTVSTAGHATSPAPSWALRRTSNPGRRPRCPRRERSASRRGVVLVSRVAVRVDLGDLGPFGGGGRAPGTRIERSAGRERLRGRALRRSYPMASMCAIAGHVLVLDCRSLAVEHVAFEPRRKGVSITIIDTRARHALVDGDCRRAKCV